MHLGFSKNEALRLQKLQNYRILDTEPESAFDDLTRLAALVCDMPIAVISLVDADRLWFKSCFGLDAAEVPRDGAFCTHAISQPDDILVVEDASADERFRENLLVTSTPGIRFYAGAPLLTDDGFALGTLCVLDYRPRKFKPEHIAALSLLAKQAVSQFELRRITLDSKIVAARHSQLLEQAADGIHLFDFKGRILAANPKFCEIAGRSESELLELYLQDLISPDDLLTQPIRFEEMRSGKPFTAERQYQRPDGSLVSVELSVKKIDDNTIQAIARDITERKRTEQKLVDAERRLRDFVDNSLAFFCTHDLDGVLLSVNPAACKALGYTEKELVGVNLSEILSPDAKAILPAYLEEINTKGESHGLMHIFTKTGELRIWSYRNVMRADAEGQMQVLASAQDVTELTKAESELRALFNSMSEVVVVLDKDGRYLNIPPTNPELLYRPPGEILGKTLHEVFPVEQADYFYGHIQTALETNQTQRFDYKLEIDGREIWFAGAVTAMTSDTVLIVASDITTRKRAEEKLIESENRFREFINNSPAVIFLKDELGQYVTVNRSFEELMNVKFEDLYGKTDFEILPKDVAVSVRANDQIVRDTGRSLKAEEFVPAHDGTPHYWISHKFPLNNDAGNKFVGGIAINISDRKQMETNLEKARDAALESTRLKSAFLSNVSHEIRTPMNGVIGMTELLLETQLDPTQREYTEIIRQSGDALLTVIDDILDLAKIEAGKLRFEEIDFDVRETVESTVKMLAERAHRKNLEIASLVQTDVPMIVRGDAGRLKQVLTNLIGNAVKYTEKGQIGVNVKIEKLDAYNIFLRFTVSDTGIGIAPGDIRHLFQPFVQIDDSPTRRFGGTGLGLVISKQIVEMMDGEISVESEPNLGSKFSFTACFESVGGKRSKKTDGSQRLEGKKILIADEKKITRDTLNDYALSWNMQPQKAASGGEILEELAVAASNNDTFDIAVININLPDLAGFDLARRIKLVELLNPKVELLNNTKVILTTSFGRSGEGIEASEAQSLGVAAYLTKPVRRSQFFECLIAVLGGAVPGGMAEVDSSVSDPTATPLVMNHTLSEAKAGFDAADKSQPDNEPTILVVEDNEVNRRVILLQLEQLGIKADIAVDGFDALEKIAVRDYPLILMDCQMPRLDGYETTREIRRREQKRRDLGEEFPRVTIIALTAHSLTGEAEKCLAAGMNEFMAKPMKISELSTICRFLDGSVSNPESPVSLNMPTDGTSIQDFDEEIIQLYFSETARRITEIEDALNREDKQEITRLAHAVRGNALAIKDIGTAGIAIRLEEHGKQGDMEHIPALLQKLKDELNILTTQFTMAS